MQVVNSRADSLGPVDISRVCSNLVLPKSSGLKEVALIDLLEEDSGQLSTERNPLILHRADLSPSLLPEVDSSLSLTSESTQMTTRPLITPCKDRVISCLRHLPRSLLTPRKKCEPAVL